MFQMLLLHELQQLLLIVDRSIGILELFRIYIRIEVLEKSSLLFFQRKLWLALSWILK